MNKEDIIVMAIKSHLVMYDYDHPSLEAFAKLVAEKERERFIQICNHQADIATDYLDKNLLWQLRDAVRARGQA